MFYIFQRFRRKNYTPRDWYLLAQKYYILTIKFIKFKYIYKVLYPII